MFKEKYMTESNENESKRDQEKEITFDDFYKNTKIKRTYSAHVLTKGKEVPSSPAEPKKQVACSGISRNRPRRTTLSFFYMVSRKEKQSCKMLRVLEV